VQSRRIAAAFEEGTVAGVEVAFGRQCFREQNVVSVQFDVEIINPRAPDFR
jgi:hypothetical protein